MYKFLKCIIAFLLCSVVLCCHEKTKNQDYEDYLTTIEAFGFSGSIFMQKQSSILVDTHLGLANRKNDIKTSKHTYFYIASIAKSFTAAAILKLADMDLLKTTDTINLYFEDCPEEMQEITIHNLLTHTSGIQSFGWDLKQNDWSIMSKEESVKGILATAIFKKGTFQYNNANYILLAAIIEKASGSSYQDFISDHLLKPMQLQNTFFGHNVPLEVKKNLAKNYYSDKDMGIYTDYDKSWLRIGGGDIISTASDLNKWISKLYYGDVLSQDSKKRMFSIQKEIQPNFGYGYGWYIRAFPTLGKRVIFHTGGFKGYASEVRLYPDSHLSVAITTNDNVLDHATESIVNDLVGMSKGSPNPLPKLDISSRDGKKYAGTYRLDSASVIKLTSFKNFMTAELYGQKAISIIEPLDYQLGVDMNSKTKALLKEIKIDPKNAFKSVLPKEDLNYLDEYATEWNDFVNNKDFNFKITQTERLKDNIYRTYAVVTVQDTATKYFGFIWKDGKVIGTAPNKKHTPYVLRLFPLANNHFINYDWESKEIQHWSFTSDNYLTVLSKELNIKAKMQLKN